jgi:hypothetical protein
MPPENGHDAEIRPPCNLLGNLPSVRSSRLGPHVLEAPLRHQRQRASRCPSSDESGASHQGRRRDTSTGTWRAACVSWRVLQFSWESLRLALGPKLPLGTAGPRSSASAPKPTGRAAHRLVKRRGPRCHLRKPTSFDTGQRATTRSTRAQPSGQIGREQNRGRSLEQVRSQAELATEEN